MTSGDMLHIPEGIDGDRQGGLEHGRYRRQLQSVIFIGEIIGTRIRYRFHNSEDEGLLQVSGRSFHTGESCMAFALRDLFVGLEGVHS